MNFYQAQDEAQRRTKWLLVYFALAVIGVVGTIYAVVAGYYVGQSAYSATAQPVNWWSLGLFVKVAVPTVAVILAATFWKSYQLSGGGAVVARDLGARQVDSRTTDTQERRLLNVVEEMAIASGMPTPQVWIMDRESGINAFAAGSEPANAVIGVTQGCLDSLTRAELQAVVAHEFSHILNGDMKLNMRLIGWLFGIMMLVLIGRELMFFLSHVRVGNRKNENGGGAVVAGWLIAVVLVIVGSIGAFFARLIQAAVSRQREFLADASAVQFTRDPDSVVSVLQKLRHKGKLSQSARASEASHMFFGDAGLFSYGLATHPPIEARISAVLEREIVAEIPKDAEELEVSTQSNFGEESRVRHLAGKGIRDDLPREWIDASHDPLEAQSMLYGLLLPEEGRLKKRCLRDLDSQLPKEIAQAAESWAGKLQPLDSSSKMAVIDLALPALRQVSRATYRQFISITKQLVENDGQVTLFELMLQKALERHLICVFEGTEDFRVRYTKVAQLKEALTVVLSSLAGVGGDSDAERQLAYKKALGSLGDEARSWGELLPPEQCSLAELSTALEALRSASPPLQGEILQACAEAVMSGGDYEDRALLILRVVADVMGVGVPPIVK